MQLPAFARARQWFSAACLSVLLATGAHADTDEIVYFHTDANGSPTAAFNEAGEVCWTETYSPYGEKLDNEDSLPPTEGCGLIDTADVAYTGHVQDSSGLVYAQQRYYDPVIGRFMSTDPTMPSAADPKYFGRYQYGGNNPYKYVDPSGEFLVTTGIVVAAWLISDIILPAAFPTDCNGCVESAGFPLDAGAALGGLKAGIRGTNAVAGGLTKTADDTVDVYRAFGDDARAQGFSWTTKDPQKMSDFRDAAGLPSGGASGANNSADFLVKGKANTSDIIKSRPALPLDGNKGGLPELIIDPINVHITDFSVLNP